MAGQVMKVKREVLEACMTCPICHKLLMEATTISLCLHTFCRKCIYEKLSDEEADCCPVCNIDLGCLPVEKLRPDHNLQDIRAKIFPFKRRKVEAPQVTPSVALPAKRKERSLSSLVVSTPKVPLQTGLTGRRSKSGSRKAAASRGSVAAELTKKEDSLEDGPLSTSSLESRKSLQTKRQNSEPSNDHKFKEDVGNDAETTEGKADLWTPLNCLVEAANRTKSSKSNFQGLSVCKSESNSEFEPHSPEMKSKAESSNGVNGEVYTRKTKNKNKTLDLKDQGDKNGSNSLLASVKLRRLPAARKKEDMTDDRKLSAQITVDTCRDGNLRKNNPIWFSLVPSEDKKEVVNLPQISACYLRIKDGNMPVSFILKYLMKKLDLASESEVEILCGGQPVPPTLELHKVVDLWFHTTPTDKKVPVSVGSSAKEFVMALTYRRKVQSS